jgi:AraC family transcriptional regulator, regulatory protein of adaptative response / DNA-3-methyladenine glycosylase II
MIARARATEPTVETAPASDETVLDRELCYRALRARDARFDGRFYTAVTSTGIYCRPICPARTPKLENCLFFPSAAAAQRLGFRPCLRCRPEAAPGHAVARGTRNTVSRALQLIADGQLGSGELEVFSGRLGIGSRQLRRLFERHVGASPQQVAQTQRMLLAKQLLTETQLPISQVALAAGFGSVRRFNAAFRSTYTRAPSDVRQRQSKRRSAEQHDPVVELRLAYAPPYDFAAMLEFLGPRAIPGVERVHDGSYQRAFRLGESFGSFEVREDPERAQLIARIHCTDVEPLGQVVARLRRLFDLDADSRTIDAQLCLDPSLATRVRARPGVRVPGAWDHFELAVRAVLGQQVSVSAATTFAARIVAQYGTPLPDSARLPHSAADSAAPGRLFPEPAQLARASFEGIGLTGARIATLQALARAVCDDASCLQPAASLEDSVAQLCALPGIGPWTAQYIAMRALREPDALPIGDLGLLRALFGSSARVPPRQMELRTQVFRPFRAYACLRLWLQPL